MVIVTFDLETQRLISLGAGPDTLQMSVACSFDTEAYTTWWEPQAPDLIEELHRADLLVGFNVNAFDFKVLSFYGDVTGLEAKTFDLLDEIRYQTGRQISLDRLASINLNETKSHTGIQAVELWRTGKLNELAEKCRQDVELTYRLFDLWRTQGIIWVSETTYAVWPGYNLADLLDILDEEDE